MTSRRRLRLLSAACVALSVAASVLAQEGHPLVGTWYGDWGSSPQQRNDVTMVMTWDGKTIGGTIDPGPNAVPFKSATLDSSTWSVHIEAERAAKGNAPAVRYVIDGKISNLGSYNRTLSGTWTQDSTKGDFKLTRD
jgi:hypothetical protein